MLSTSIIKNTSDASHYYSAKDNYYTVDEGISQSEWYGKGAQQLNLSGQVNPEQFTALLKGLLPNGKQLGKIEDGIVKHRPGWDLTLSAPKSFSILALLGGDKRLLDAQCRAVKVTLDQIERSASEARIKINGEIHYTNTKNIVAALHHHDSSRELDPQVHTHCVVMNATERSDKEWRSQASKMGRYDKEASGEIHGFLERVRHHKRYFGKLYEAELCYQVNQLGYKTIINPKTGVFEIADVPKELIEHFSKRSESIKKSLAENGLHSAKAADIANLKTRQKKQKVDRSELKEQWKKEATQFNFDPEAIVTKAIERSKGVIQETIPNGIELSRKLLDAIKSASYELSQFKTTFLLEEVITRAAGYAIREKYNVESLLHAAQHALKSGELISIDNTYGKTLLMDKKILEQEKTILGCLTSQHKLKKEINTAIVNQFIEQHDELSSDTKDAMKTVFSNHAYTLVDGDQSRESLLKPIVQFTKANDVKVAIVSPNQIGSKRTANSIKDTPTTLWQHIKTFFKDDTISNYSTMRFLNDAAIKQPDLLLVDKSHLLSTNELSQLMTWGKDNQKQILFFGNKNTLLSQKQGNGLSYLIEHGLKMVSLKEEVGSIKDLVAQNDLKNISKKIANHLIETPDPKNRLNSMVSEFAREDKQIRKSIFLMANNKQAVLELNQLAHDELKRTGKLGDSVKFRVLLPQFINASQIRIAKTYQNRNIIRFNENISSSGVRWGDYCEVLSHNKEKNELRLQNARGKIFQLNPERLEKNPEVFKPVEREISVGERIQLHRSIKQKNLLKGEYLTIQSISKNHIAVQNEKGKTILLDRNKLNHLHFDYGYAATPHQLAHEMPVKIIAELPHRSFHTDKRQLFQIISQPKEISIYTDNKEALINTLSNKSGDRLSAHETLNHSNQLKQESRTLYEVLTQLSKESLSKDATDGIDYAVKHLSEREAAFSHKTLMVTAIQRTIGKVNLKEFEQVVSAMKKANLLIRKDTPRGTFWTTMDAIQTERQIIELSKQDQSKFKSLVSLNRVEDHLNITSLSIEQKNAIKQITQSEDRILAIQGRAGTGKTTLMTTLSDVVATKDLITSEGYQLRGLAPTHPAVKEMSSRGIPAQTLDSFLIEMQKAIGASKPDFSHTIFVLDEASMVSNSKMLSILKIAHELNFRQLILVGDTRQLPSIEDGKPQAIMQKQINTIHLQDIQRQKNPTLQQGVKETYAYDFKATFETLKESIIEIGNPSHYSLSHRKKSWDELSEKGRIDRIKVLVSDYVSHSPDERKQVLVITPGHEDRKLTNALIRDHLKQEGSLVGHEYLFSILSAKNLTHAERSDIRRYKDGEVIRFGKTEGNIKVGEYWSIESVNQENRLLTLKDNEGKEIIWELPKIREKGRQSFEVFQREERMLQVGDHIRWSRTDKSNQLYSSEPVKVVAIQANKATLEYADKKQITMDLTKSPSQHWDYNYALTVYAAQGSTKLTVLALLESYRENLIHQSAFLVALTRAVDHFRVYTDNKAAVLDRIEQNSGEKLSALETIGEPKKGKQNTHLREQSLPKQTAKNLRFDKETITQMIEALNQDAEKIATNLLGKPVSRTSHYLQFGTNKGSLRVTISGQKSGLWNDFSGELSHHGKTGGNMFQFLQIFGGMTKKEVLEYSAKRFGYIKNGEFNANNEAITQWKKENEIRLKTQQRNEQKRQEKRIQIARKLAGESKPIEGTLAQQYLKEERSILLNIHSSDIRFHEGVYSKLNEKTYPAMLVIARDKEGNIKAVQATYLNQNAKKIDKETHAIQKQTFGVLIGASLSVKASKIGSKPSTTLIAEGVETGLSLAKACPEKDIQIVLGKSNLLHIDPKKITKYVVFCLDNDSKDMKDDKIIFESAKRLHEAGKNVSLTLPSALGNIKQDYNDVLKKLGTIPIKNDVQKAESFQNYYSHQIISNPILPSISKSVSEEKINRVAREMVNQSMKNEQKIMSAYRQMNQAESKPITQIRDVEREI